MDENSITLGANEEELKELMNLAQVSEANATIDRLEEAFLALPQDAVPTYHHFSPGVYMRQITVPAGRFIIGHKHKTEHLNIMVTGRMTLMVNGNQVEVSAPYIVKSLPGSRKMAYTHEETIWISIHPTIETNTRKLEDELIEKSPAFLNHEKLLEDNNIVQLEQPITQI